MAVKSWLLMLAVAIVLLITGVIGISLLPGESDNDNKFIVIGTAQLAAIDLNTLQGFIVGMAEHGYREGKEIHYITPKPAGNVEQLNEIFTDYVERKVDLMFISSTPATIAVKPIAEEHQIPVVFAPVNDPLRAGVVNSLQNPGGQLTGIKLPVGDEARMNWFQRAVKGVERVYIPFNPKDPSSVESLRNARIASEQLGIEVVTDTMSNSDEITKKLAQLPNGIDGIFLPRDSTLHSNINLFVTVAKEKHIPLCSASLVGVRRGALMSYGFDHFEIGRQASRLAVEIIKGVKPGELPVESAENFLAINLNMAEAIDFSFPSEVLRNTHLKIDKQ